MYATATEDMDALTFRTPKLLRKLTFSQDKDKKQPILEIDFEAVLTGMELTYEQFVDLCIMCGCDYCGTIKGIGPKTAFKLIKQHGTLENVIAALRKEKKYQIPDDWKRIRVPKACSAESVEEGTEAPAGDGESAPAGAAVEDTGDVEGDEPEESDFEIIEPLYRQARTLFHTPEVTPAEELTLKWEAPDEVKLRAFLVDKMGFNGERVDAGIKRLLETQQKMYEVWQI